MVVEVKLQKNEAVVKKPDTRPVLRYAVFDLKNRKNWLEKIKQIQKVVNLK